MSAVTKTVRTVVSCPKLTLSAEGPVKCEARVSRSRGGTGESTFIIELDRDEISNWIEALCEIQRDMRGVPKPAALTAAIRGI